MTCRRDVGLFRLPLTSTCGIGLTFEGISKEVRECVIYESYVMPSQNICIVEYFRRGMGVFMIMKESLRG